MWILWVLSAEAREVVDWVRPDWPDSEATCEAILDVTAEGEVSLKKLKGCPAHEAVVSAAVTRWRYEPAPEATVEEVPLSHRPAYPGRVLAQSRPEWPDAEVASEGRTCFVKATLDEQGAVAGLQVSECSDAPRLVLEEAVRQWRFAPGPETELWLHPVLQVNKLSPASRVNPAFPADAEASEASCTAKVVVSPEGRVAVKGVQGCPDAFAEATAQTLMKWRYPATDRAWSTVISTTYRRR